ncbi:MAG TPA: DUF881 domain-containing protein [Marmoricola sp.]|nr:DUF881 domain-containing protein [Marmoricola sp.]
MHSSPHRDPRPGPRGAAAVLRRLRPSGPRRRWGMLTPLAFAGAGVLLVTSAVNADGTDLRPDTSSDLADLAQQETARVQRLHEEVAELNADIETLSDQLDDTKVEELQQQIDALEMPAGLTAVEGPGITVTLEDAPRETQEAAGDDVSNAIVHQQDIQAVANALWAGGAEAMTLQGQRVVSTTGIKCVGNTVLLHGVTYSPPYVISAIGDVDAMRAQIESSPYLAAYLEAVDQYQLGWDVEEEAHLELPAFTGSTEMRYARPGDAV